MGEGTGSVRGRSGVAISDGAFFAIACLLFFLISLILALLASAFSSQVWQLGDTARFFAMADVIVRGGVPYIDYQDPKPPLIFFLLAVPLALGAKAIGSYLLVALANAVSAAAIAKIGWRLCGRAAGLLAGLLFLLNLAWAEGYFVLTEPFAITFMALSLCCLVCGGRQRYFLAGLGAGLAVGFKQYALLLLPLTLYYALRKKEAPGMIHYLAGVLLPLLLAFAALFLWYGPTAGNSALYWSFGVATDYVADSSVAGVPVYRIGDPVIAASWVLLALSLFAPLLTVATVSVLRWKLRIEDELFALAAIAFAATLLIRPFLHYWAFLVPLLALLAGRALGHALERRPLRPGNRAGFFALATSMAAALLAAAIACDVLIEARWRPLGIQEFYGLADIVLRSLAPYLGTFGGESAGALALVTLMGTALLCYLGALAAAATAWRLYGPYAALAAGLIFTASAAFALGSLAPADALALLLLALSTLALTLELRGRHLLAGLLLGAAIALKAFAFPLALAGIAFLLLGGRRQGVAPYVCGLLLPLALAALAAPGLLAGGLAGPAYDAADPLLALVGIAAAGAFAGTAPVFAIMAVRGRGAGAVEICFLAMALLPFCTLLIHAFPAYWFLALPFASVLCARPFGRPPSVSAPSVRVPESGDQKLVKRGPA